MVFSAGQSAQDLALAALIGGNLFGRVAMHPALTEVSRQAERGKVLNRAWRRYGVVNSLALGTLVAGWLPVRLHRARSRWLSPRERRLVLAEDAAMGAVVVTGLAAAAMAAGVALLAVNSALVQANFRRPPRRALRRRDG